MTELYQTDRLIVKHWEDKDYKDLYEYCSNDEVTKFLFFPTYKDLETAKERIKDMQEGYLSKSMIVDYAIELKSISKVIGTIGFVKYSENNEGEIEIGYILNPTYQGNGYMTEALKGMFKYIKINNIAKRITLKHDVLNIKSGNVMKRAGMTFEGILRKATRNNLHNRADAALYSILDEEISLD
ncbi:MAG: GNAT family N-acetyltransferase [Christensenellales bacterium]